ncbi:MULTISPECIES: hypothetical protein [unclassified Nocardioides]|uniref:hypothetical protein n=1 Tax=unclassified Nocardioides TaxID=2615069 RepID=UPI000057195E|nr:MULTISPECIES: hypothetical protein [unclassified Nocardioides]ABL79731.1 hypothetical protein Noca_0186 [Nocardioides sp. JS614]MBI2242880.1 hypothetical protein [Nocardioides sp.]
MTITTTGMSVALQGLRQALYSLSEPGVSLGSWRWSVRQQMAGVRDALLAEAEYADEGWLAARTGSVLRERTALLGRLSALGTPVLESDDVDAVCTELDRLLVDLGRHAQRLHDLAYDEVELELGGSE